MKIRDRIRELRRVPASELRPNPKNWRTHPEAQANALKGLLAEVGIADAVLARELPDGSLMLLDGHLRAETLGDQVVPVLVLDVDEAEGDKVLVTLDPLAAMAEANAAKLDAILRTTDTGSPDVQQLLADLADEAGLYQDEAKEIVEDEIPEPLADPITKPGDLWMLGEHRLLCGDSTKADDVGRLMVGAKADLCFTSPPYANQRTYTKEGDLSTEHLARFIPSAKESARLFAVNLGLARHGGQIVRYWDDYIEAAEKCGLQLLSWNVWSRHGYGGSIGNMTAMFPIEHEWILVFGLEEVELNRTVANKHGGKRVSATVRGADGDMSNARKCDVHAMGKLGSVFVSDVERGVKPHPAMFPVAFPAAYIAACCSDGNNVYEPFCGSGTTLIAAEQLGRKCYGMEISPQYCDVIVKRWETLTGKKASLANE